MGTPKRFASFNSFPWKANNSLWLTRSIVARAVLVHLGVRFPSDLVCIIIKALQTNEQTKELNWKSELKNRHVDYGKEGKRRASNANESAISYLWKINVRAIVFCPCIKFIWNKQIRQKQIKQRFCIAQASKN